MRARVLLSSLAVLMAGAFPASASETTLALRCDGRDGAVEAMENEYIVATAYGACWFHVGHHTYDLGGRYLLGTMTGSVVSVEQAFSPPAEFGIERTVVLDASPDGIAWTILGRIEYADRESVPFEIDGRGFAARYVRIRQPRSAAQGLSGFLDASGLDVVATPAPVAEAPTPPVRALSCSEDVMERMFDTHPCWFGGINRYDSPSVFHTYPIGDTSLTRVEGTAMFAPWRTDDYYYDGGSPTDVAGVVQISSDGARWTLLGRIAGRYGEPIAFDFPEAGVQASYVRIVAEYHRGVRRHPALKHARGMLVDSALRVTSG